MNGMYISDFILENKLGNVDVIIGDDYLKSTIILAKNDWIDYELHEGIPNGLIIHRKVEKLEDGVKTSSVMLTTNEALDLRYWGNKLYE